MRWCGVRSAIALHDIPPVKPVQNPFLERFDRISRTNVLDASFFGHWIGYDLSGLITISGISCRDYSVALRDRSGVVSFFFLHMVVNGCLPGMPVIGKHIRLSNAVSNNELKRVGMDENGRGKSEEATWPSPPG